MNEVAGAILQRPRYQAYGILTDHVKNTQRNYYDVFVIGEVNAGKPLNNNCTPHASPILF